MDMLSLLINELAWAIIHNPENEQRKLIILNFIGRIRVDVATMLHPFVISILPKNIEYKEFIGICISDSI